MANRLRSDDGGFVLASASPSRAQVLRNVGLTFEIDPANIDEAALKRDIGPNASLNERPAAPGELATALAMAKAEFVSGRHPGRLVLGADQVLLCEGQLFDKPADVAEAREHLNQLKGRRHTLVAALAVVKDNEVLWHYVEEVHLQMRDFSDAFLDAYLQEVGEQVLFSVGAYQLEGVGAQLFDQIEGDFFTVLGLPLLPLLDFFRSRGVIGL